ncbi:MAG: helix-turn-helix transcriptional regulator [Anaerolineae bacterium]|nr:helix-turn-helix transcriptional regulator [Anaerolineae bacterium]
MEKEQIRIRLRTKKIGLLLQDARFFARYSPQECAEILGIPVEKYLDYENGYQAPALPEIEILAFVFNVPLEHFWGSQSIAGQKKGMQEADLQRLLTLRNRIIQTRLKQLILEAGLNSAQLAERTGLDEQVIKKIEEGRAPVKLPELEILCSALNIRIEELFDQKGIIGEWHRRRQSIEKFDHLSPALQDFVSKPVNHPFVELARRLSDLSVEKLRAVAEGLLEITY